MKTQDELMAQTASLARVQAELEASQQHARQLADERKEAQDKCLHALAELSHLRHRVEDSKRQLDDHEFLKASAAASAELKEQAKEQAEVELHRVEAELHSVEGELRRAQGDLR